MKILTKLEQTLENIFEGLFRRGFKGDIQPVEIGRRLVRSLEEKKKVSISRTYVPNVYKVYLHPKDKENLDSFSGSLRDELIGYLQQAAKREDYFFVRPPEVEFIAKEEQQPGSVTIETCFHEGESANTGPLEEVAPLCDQGTNVFPRASSSLVVSQGPDRGKEVYISKDSIIIGRGPDSDLVLSDKNASRKHARLDKTPQGYLLTDLGSLNGTYVDDKKIKTQNLAPEDMFRLGSTLVQLKSK